MLGLDLDHVAIAVPSLDEAIRLHQSISGAPATEPETLPGQGVRVAFVGPIELLEPLHPDTPVGRFLSKRGAGFHHIAYRADDIAKELGRLTAAGYEPIDRTPRPGARGHLVAFLHPRTTGGVLVELVQHG
jgi:methylmalonyl-CoA/ethylmalonyl-CoA epimerase